MTKTKKNQKLSENIFISNLSLNMSMLGAGQIPVVNSNDNNPNLKKKLLKDLDEAIKFRKKASLKNHTVGTARIKAKALLKGRKVRKILGKKESNPNTKQDLNNGVALAVYKGDKTTNALKEIKQYLMNVPGTNLDIDALNIKIKDIYNAHQIKVNIRGLQQEIKLNRKNLKRSSTLLNNATKNFEKGVIPEFTPGRSTLYGENAIGYLRVDHERKKSNAAETIKSLADQEKLLLKNTQKNEVIKSKFSIVLDKIVSFFTKKLFPPKAYSVEDSNLSSVNEKTAILKSQNEIDNRRTKKIGVATSRFSIVFDKIMSFFTEPLFPTKPKMDYKATNQVNINKNNARIKPANIDYTKSDRIKLKPFKIIEEFEKRMATQPHDIPKPSNSPNNSKPDNKLSR